MMGTIVGLASPMLLAIALFIETSSWWVRALARPGLAGLYVSRSNIYLYGGRLFSLAFTSLLALWIELGASPAALSSQLAASMAVAAGLQYALLKPRWSQRLILNAITRSLRLPTPGLGPHEHHRLVRPLFVSTAGSAAIFGLGTGLPLLAAVLVPEYRLSVSYLGQIINSAGTLLILVLVDQKLFRSLDSGTLLHDVHSYGMGRITGFLFSAACFVVTSVLLS